MLDADGHIELGKDPQRAEQHDFAMAIVADKLPYMRKVLDLGCGFGEMANRCALHAPNRCVIASDASRDLLHAVNNGAHETELVNANALALPFAFGSIDLVICLGLIEHVADPIRLLSQIRCAAHGGHALIMTPNIGRPRRLLKSLRGEQLHGRAGHRFGYDYHLFLQVLERHCKHVEITTRFVDAPWRWLSHCRRYRRRFAMAGSELYAWCKL